MREERFFEGPAGRLDARLHGPAGGPPVVLLHPHPRLGGTMGSRLVRDAAVRLGDLGWRVVRFDFRGVGRSAGAYGDGVGEAADAAAVVGDVAAGAKESPVLVGYSFGGAVACRVAAEAPVRRLVLVATPVSPLCSLRPLDDAPRVRAPCGLVAGRGDPHLPEADVERLAASFQPAAPVTWVPGAGHFLEPAGIRAGVDALCGLLGRP